MSAAVVFILFVICLVIAIPVSISLGIVAVLPGAFDSSFTASASYVIRSMLGGIDSFPLFSGAYVLCLPESSWHTAKSHKNCLMFLCIL